MAPLQIMMQEMHLSVHLQQLKVETGQALSGYFDDYKFTHFHFQGPSGSMTFPQMRGDNQYSSKEVAMFTISTLQDHTVYLNTLDIEDEPLCRYDTFSRFKSIPDESYWYRRFGKETKDYR